MASTRFHKAAQLAARSNTWNTNDVAEAINEQLHEERDKQIGTGFGNLLDAWDKADARLQAHKDMVFDNPMLNFLSSVDAGYYPSPDVLVAISKCFSSYFQSSHILWHLSCAQSIVSNQSLFEQTISLLIKKIFENIQKQHQICPQ